MASFHLIYIEELVDTHVLVMVGGLFALFDTHVDRFKTVWNILTTIRCVVLADLLVIA